RVGRWELGVLGVYELHYTDVSNHVPSDRDARALALGIGVGRREPLENAALLVGARLFVAAVDHRDQQVSSSAEGRAGVYLGMALPERARLRLRADLTADFVAAGAVSATSRAGESVVPVTPAWALGAMIGVEVDAL
ncbi:MAG TPA: hypothetical protein VK524_19180, partial [Polyangiaceae bacterium]|nr:hypothetical protein [Polyangiaceae bacterium]